MTVCCLHIDCVLTVQTEFHQRAFELLRDRLTDIQQNGRVVEETHELERAGMYEQVLVPIVAIYAVCVLLLIQCVLLLMQCSPRPCSLRAVANAVCMQAAQSTARIRQLESEVVCELHCSLSLTGSNRTE